MKKYLLWEKKRTFAKQIYRLEIKLIFSTLKLWSIYRIYVKKDDTKGLKALKTTVSDGSGSKENIST